MNSNSSRDRRHDALPKRIWLLLIAAPMLSAMASCSRGLARAEAQQGAQGMAQGRDRHGMMDWRDAYQTPNWSDAEIAATFKKLFHVPPRNLGLERLAGADIGGNWMPWEQCDG